MNHENVVIIRNYLVKNRAFFALNRAEGRKCAIFALLSNWLKVNDIRFLYNLRVL